MLYKAFISYSHAADGKLAPALQSALQRFARPWYRRRAIRVFRDQTNLSISPGLWGTIESALSQTEFFVLLCSPEAAAAKWVRREVEFWLQRRSPETLLLILTEGEMAWDAESGGFDQAKTTALPAGLATVYREEPLYLDLRAARTAVDLSLSDPDFRDKIADLSATLRGISKDEMIGEDLRQHRRTKAIAWAVGMALAIAAVVSAGFAWVAVVQRGRAQTSAREAQEQRGVAEHQRGVAEENARRAEASAQEATQQRRAAEASAEEARRQRDEAVTQRRNAESREFAARALLAVETDPAAALGLAIQAGGRGDNPSSEAALRSALGASHAEAILRRPGGIAQAAFTPDGRHLLTADAAVTVWDARSASVIASLPPSRARPGGRFAQVVVSPNGARVAARIADEVHVWDMASPTRAVTFTTPGVTRTSHIAFSPDGSKILAVYGASVTVRSTETGQELLRVSGTILIHAAFSPDGRVFAAASTDGYSVTLWDTETGRRRGSVSTGGRSRSVEFSPDGQWLAATSEARGLKLWRLADSTGPVPAVAGAHLGASESVFACAHFHGGSTAIQLVTCGSDGVVRVWEHALGEQLRWEEVGALRGHQKAVLDAVFDATGSLLVSAGEDGTARVWVRRPPAIFQRASWHPLAVLRGHQGRVVGARLSPDGRRLVTVADDWTARLWNTEPRREVGTLGPLWAKIYEIAVDSAGDRVLVTTATGPPKLWAATTGALRSLGTESARSARFSPDDAHVLVAGPGREAVLYDTGSGEARVVLRGHENMVESAEFGAGGRRVVTTGTDYTVRLWDARSGQPLRVIQGPRTIPGSASLAADDRRIVSVWWDGRAFVWSDAGEELAVLDHGKGKIYEARLSRDGRQLLTWGSGSIRLWDARTWQITRSLEGELTSRALSLPDSRYAAFAHADGAVDLTRLDRPAKAVRLSGHRAQVRIATLSADGSRALTGDEEGTVRLWDTATGSSLAALHDHEGPITAVRFSASGRLFVTGGEDGTVRAYYTRVGDLLDLARSRVPPSR